MKTKIQLFAERLAKTVDTYCKLNEGEKLDALALADSLCDDLDRPRNLIALLESMTRNVVWMQAKADKP
jgi:hypothetical protein